MRSTTIQLNPRERRFVIAGAVIATLLLLFWLWPSGTDDQSNVELVPKDGRPAVAAPPLVPVVQTPPAVVPVVAAVPASTPDGLVLRGVAAEGAIIASADGNQRYVGIGRDVLPGLRLQSVQLHHAILGNATTSYRLGFNGPAVALAPPAAGPAQPTAAVGAVDSQRAAAERAQTAQLRVALAPRMVDGRINGYTLRPGVGIPALAQAGLQPGDTILTVNGSVLDAERMEELAWSVANSTRTEFEVERGGRRVRLAVQGAR